MWEKKVPELILKKAVYLTLAEENNVQDKQISLALVPSDIIRELNLKYRGEDSLTDVLAFPLQGEVGPAKRFLGEIIICPSLALIQANERGHSLEEELILLVVHGTLHLLGYKDNEDEEKRLMGNKAKNILKLLGKRENII